MKNSLIMWIVGGIIILGGVYYFMMSGTATDTVRTSSESVSDDIIQTSDFESIFKKGGSYECTVAMKTEQASSNGTIYVSGTNVRGEFTSVAGGQTIKSYMIQADGYVYTWTSMLPQGFKFKSTVDANPFSATGSMKMPEGGSYTCKKWTPDNGKFVPPTEVKFAEAPAGTY